MKLNKIAAIVMVLVASNNAQANLTGSDLIAANEYFYSNPDIEIHAPWIKQLVLEKNDLTYANNYLIGNSYFDGTTTIFTKPITVLVSATQPTHTISAAERAENEAKETAARLNNQIAANYLTKDAALAAAQSVSENQANKGQVHSDTLVTPYADEVKESLHRAVAGAESHVKGQVYGGDTEYHMGNDAKNDKMVTDATDAPNAAKYDARAVERAENAAKQTAARLNNQIAANYLTKDAALAASQSVSENQANKGQVHSDTLVSSYADQVKESLHRAVAGAESHVKGQVFAGNAQVMQSVPQSQPDAIPVAQLVPQIEPTQRIPSVKPQSVPSLVPTAIAQSEPKPMAVPSKTEQRVPAMPQSQPDAIPVAQLVPQIEPTQRIPSVKPQSVPELAPTAIAQSEPKPMAVPGKIEQRVPAMPQSQPKAPSESHLDKTVITPQPTQATPMIMAKPETTSTTVANEVVTVDSHVTVDELKAGAHDGDRLASMNIAASTAQAKVYVDQKAAEVEATEQPQISTMAATEQQHFTTLQADMKQAQDAGADAQDSATKALTKAARVEATEQQHFTTLQADVKHAENTGAYAQKRAADAMAYAEANRQALADTNARVSQNTADIQAQGQQQAAFEAQTNQKFSNIDKKIDKVEKKAMRGIAGANALAGLPQLNQDDTFGVSAAIGGYEGESAIAVGASAHPFENKAMTVKAGVTATNGAMGWNAGVGYSFK